MKVQMMALGFLLLAASPLGAGERLALHVSPNICFAPADLVVRATVESDAGNRAIEVVADSGEFFRASEIQLDGDKAPHTTTIEFRNLPSGAYEVKATLIGANGRTRALVRQDVNVISSGAGR
jgi:hypothetical protein